MSNLEYVKKIFNVGIFGDKDSGKTSLIKRIITGKFITKKIIPFNNPEIKTLNEKQYKFYDIEHDNKNINCVFDTIILIIDLSSLLNYKNIPNWFEFITVTYKTKNIILVGTKSDLYKIRQVDNDIIIHLCNNYKNYSIKYIETSAKEGKNIAELINMIIFNCSLNINKQINQNNDNDSKKTNMYSTFDKEEHEIIKLLPNKKKSVISKIIDSIFCCFK
ncbi:Rab-like GTPase [Bodo saltans virus]|jgi:GTPase SAR1 family protein|uniref:Rab-like GTPase n=1 Tax=Bodo saltans virus TaxID=2024608 RepID=A0A2H4UVE8_9VIRU|nr:Rab-like GTPase [Bodo saltans virus]ATZ80805.1 Rab-like GTPase [Bodo saltans virus]